MGTSTTSTTTTTTSSTTTTSTTTTTKSTPTTTTTTTTTSTSTSTSTSHETPKEAKAIDWKTFEKMHVEWHRRMKDHKHDDLKPSSEAPKTEEPKFDSTSTADYTSLSDLLDGTSIDEVYPEELPLNPLPDVPESDFSDNGIDYSDIHYDNVEPDTPANLVLDKGLALDLDTTTSSTTTST